MATVKINGASDDLVELNGDLSEELNTRDDDGMVLAFGDGTILSVKTDPFGVWRITRLHTGSALFEHDEDPGDQDNRYSDRVTLTGDLGWLFAAEQPRLLQIKS